MSAGIWKGGCGVADEALVDWARLTALRELQAPDEPDIVLELVAMFHADSAQRMSRLREAAVTGDVRTLRFEAHSLRGTAAVFSAESLRACAEAVELGADDPALVLASGLVDRLDALVLAVGRALDAGPPAAV